MRSNRLTFIVSLAATLTLPLSSVAVASPSGAGGGERVDVIVALQDAHASGGHETNRARAAEIARQHGVEPTQTYGTALFGFAASVPRERLNGLRSDPRVDYVDRDGAVEAYGQTTPWGISRIGAPLTSNSGEGIHAYIIDTGIDSDHADLQNVGTGYAVEVCKGPGHRCREAWDDDHGHGTHVAGTVGADDNDIDVVGVAPGVVLHAVKVLSNSGSGSRSGVIAGIDWLTNDVRVGGYGGKAVANMSLGGSGSKTGECTDSGFSGSDAYHEAICASKNSGVVYAVAAGNSNADAENHVPAAYDDAVITVSATTASDDWPYWSNWGDDAASWTDHVSAPVAIAAPGASVLSTALGGGTTTMSGTSMAAPHVAGAAALYLKANVQSANGTAFANVRAGLLAADEATGGWDNTSGYVHNEDFLDVRELGTTTSTALTVSDLSASPDPFSPNGDEEKDTTTISFDVNAAADWTVTLSEGSSIRCSESGSTTAAATVTFIWDGTATAQGACGGGAELPDAAYTVAVDAETSTESAPQQTTHVTIDTTAPVIDNVHATPASSSADVAWTTAEDASTSTVRYWVSGGTTVMTAGDSVLVENHDVTLVDLSSDTTYEYEVESVDAAGNKSVSGIGSFITATSTSGGMYVEDIAFSVKTYGPGGSFKDLTAVVTVREDRDGDGADAGDPVVSNANVGFRFTLDDGDGTYDCGVDSGDQCWDLSTTTSSDGTASFVLKRAPAGNYEGRVASLTHSTLTWDASLGVVRKTTTVS